MAAGLAPRYHDGYKLVELLLACGACALAKDGMGKTTLDAAEAADASLADSAGYGTDESQLELNPQQAEARKKSVIVLLDEAMEWQPKPVTKAIPRLPGANKGGKSALGGLDTGTGKENNQTNLHPYLHPYLHPHAHA